MLMRFKVVAIMAVYNEEDIIRWSIMKLYGQGIRTYVIDNWSTDSTFKIVKELSNEGLLEGYEHYPKKPSKYFPYTKLLKRTAELAKKIDADWFIYCDADEIRVSPWKELSLREAIYKVDQLGYNAINHTVLVFEPVDDGFQAYMDFEAYFLYFNFGNRPGHFVQIRTWKKQRGKVTLGHAVQFKGIKVFPIKFLLKHYPIRGQRHGEKKVFAERLARFNPAELKAGLHVQYNVYKQNYNFLSDPKDLLCFNKETFVVPLEESNIG